MRKTGVFVLVVFVAGVVVPALFSRNRNAKAIPTSAESATTPGSIALSQTTWTPIGPQPTVPLPGNPQLGYPTVSSRVTALAFDPRDTTDKTIYAGTEGGGLWVTTDGGQSWTPLTDTQPSLFVSSIALDPTTSPTTIYVGTGGHDSYGDQRYGAGVLRSTDGGKTWTQDQTFSTIIANNPSDAWPEIASLAAAPDNNQVLLAAIGSSNGTSLPGGIWRSTDGGQTWSATGNTFSEFGPVPGRMTVLFDPSVPGQAFATISGSSEPVTDGVYESIDDGTTWTPIDTSANFETTTISLRPPTATASGALVAAFSGAIPGPPSLGNGYANLLGVYSAAIAPGGSVGAFNQLTNAPNFCGNATPGLDGQCDQYMVLAVSQTNPKLIYGGGTNEYGGDTLTMSSDGGSTWSPDLYAGNGPCTSKTSSGACINANGQLQAGTLAIAFAPDGKVLAVGGNGGVWSTGNVGASLNVTWNDLNASFDIAQIDPGISIFPGNPDRGLAGTAIAGTAEYGGTLKWEAKVCATGGYTVITPDGSKAYVSCGDDDGVYELDSSGTATWAANGLTSCTSTPKPGCYSDGDITPPLAMDVLNPSILYIAAAAGQGNNVYQTTDGGQSWQLISPVLSVTAAELTALGVSPTDDNVVYSGSAGGEVWRTSDALDGANSKWQQDSLPGSPISPVSDIVADPSLSTVAYVSFSSGGIYETTDGGQTWVTISVSLPNVGYVNALAVDPSLWHTIYAATDAGVYATTDNGVTWAKLGAGLPNAPVEGLTLDPKTRVLWAGTYGRGMWALQLAPAPLPPTAIASPASLTFNNLDAGTASQSKTITITNTGGQTLTISSIKPLQEFTETNNCGSSLPVGASCSMQVTYTPPSGVAGISGDMVIYGNLRPGFQQVPLSGSTQDFQLSAATGTISASAGQSATATIKVNPEGTDGFNDAVSLSCSGLPAEATCGFSPATVTPGSTAVTSTLNISTAAPSNVAPLFGPSGPSSMLLALWAGLLLALLLLAAMARKASKKAGFAIATCALAVCLLAPVVSCGGGSTYHNPGTPTGTYTVTVKGTSGSLEHTATVSLTVSKAAP